MVKNPLNMVEENIEICCSEWLKIHLKTSIMVEQILKFSFLKCQKISFSDNSFQGDIQIQFHSLAAVEAKINVGKKNWKVQSRLIFRNLHFPMSSWNEDNLGVDPISQHSKIPILQFSELGKFWKYSLFASILKSQFCYLFMNWE